MFAYLRAFCFATCILTGLYYLILFRYYKGLNRTLWFPVLCFCFAINVAQRLALTPSLLIGDGTQSMGFSDNIYLITLNLSSLAMNLYNGTAISREKNLYFRIFNYIAGTMAIASLAVMPAIAQAVYLVSEIIFIIACIFGLYVSYKMINAGTRIHIYSLISYVLLICSFVPSSILLVLKVDFLSFRVMMIPLYVFLHTFMLTRRYKESIYRTKKMSDSLSATIESIGHSDNALRCTQLKSEFLFDTLDLIREKCDSDPFAAEDLTIALSKFLRHTLNFQQLKGIVPLSNELELTRAYVAIEKEMYPELDFQYRIPETVPVVSVPPLSIQPLVENAIEHGLEDDKKGGKVTLTIALYKEYCQIDVSDNGKGIPEDMLADLPDAFPQTTRIGLSSINTRLITRFGKGLVIQSEPGVGTSVSFVVPPERQEDETNPEDIAL